MLFTEPLFIFFFLPILLVLYYCLGNRSRNILLLIASLIFYAYGEGFYVIVLINACLFNYITTLWIDRCEDTRYKKYVLGLGIAGNLALLWVFKYAEFAIENVNVLMGMLGQSPIILSSSIHLPIGISFFTLQALTYLIDVYKARAPVQTNPLNVGLYISLFPQLLAGPIVRYQNFAGQIVHRFTTIESFAYGTRRFIIGLAKKVIIANTLATASDGIFGIPSAQLTPSLAWFGILCYTLQIYYDFSSYSDMAIGLGYMFGFRFPENFNYPYIAGSITDFWCRWHITLATWFRDYVYIPCGGNRKGILRKYVNLILVFFLCGLWHGASWNFLVWGLMHGSILIIERWTGLHDSTNKRGMLQHIYVNFFHMIGLVVFRSESLAAALSFLSSMVGLYKGTGVEYHTGLYTNGPLVLVLLIALVGCTPLLPFVKDRLQQATGSIFGLRPVVEICTISVLIMVFGATLCVMAAQTNLPFIYFRF